MYHMVPQGPIFGPPNLVFGHFLKKVSTGLSSVLFHTVIVTTFGGMENMGLRGPIWGPKISQNSGLGHLLKKTTGFPSVLVYMSIWATFRGVLNVGLRGLISE